jgi:hypothetical protein
MIGLAGDRIRSGTAESSAAADSLIRPILTQGR